MGSVVIKYFLPSVSLRAAINLSAACVFASSGFAVAAPTALELRPSTPWNVDWGKDYCILRRAFGDGDHALALGIKQWGLGDSFQLIAAGPQMRGIGSSQKFLVIYGDGEAEDYSSYFSFYRIGNDLAVSTISSLAPGHAGQRTQQPVTPERENAVTSITLLWSGNQVVLDTGQLNKAFTALRKCTADLVKGWGLDPAEQATLSRRARPKFDLFSLLHPADFPGQQSFNNFRLMIDPDGKIAKCEIQRNFDDFKVDRLCDRLIRNAVFEPALNALGKPVASYYIEFSHVRNW